MIDRLHPLTILISFLISGLMPAFSRNPFFHLLALVTGIFALTTWTGARQILKRTPVFLLFFIIISLFNPFFYHNGDTVLFYLSGRRITLEALLFGTDSALMVTGVLIWFLTLSHYLTSDKILLLIGKISAKGATIITLVFRLIPHYSSYIKSYRRQQKLLGLYGDGSLLERVRAEYHIFGGFLTWALEHSMVTADSMTSRGYGVTKRKNYSIYTFRKRDIYMLAGSLITFAYLLFALMKGVFITEYYPVIVLPKMNLLYAGAILVYIIYSTFLSFYHHINKRRTR